MSFKAILALAVIALAAASAEAADTPRLVCYYSSWAIYRVGIGKFGPEDIDPTKCTHLIYTFIGLGLTGEVQLLDPWNDVGDEWTQGQFQKIAGLKDQNPDLKILLAIGGYNHGPGPFQTVVRDAKKRAVFVQSAFDMLNEYGFDGLDIDWEYQDGVGGTAADKTGLSLLLQEMRVKFDENGLIISIATPANLNLVKNCYDLANISKSVDFINIMAYDFHGSWEAVVGHATPLYCTSDNGLCVADVLKYYIDNGAEPSLINLGIVTYGRTWTLANETDTSVGAKASGPGVTGLWVPEGGILAYGEICANDWPLEWDDDQGVPYAYDGDQWVTYDDESSIIVKLTYAAELNVTNVFVWSVETDDKTGECNGTPYPILTKISEYFSTRK